MLYIGLDDTDMPDTRGTGHLARQIAQELATVCHIRGVSRHQLLRDPRVPMTKNNSANVIHVSATELSIRELADRVRELMLANFIPGSDPGMCLSEAPSAMQIDFGRKAKRSLVTQQEAVASLSGSQAVYACLGGTGDGIIGATAGVGLAASGNDGRFVQVGGIRGLSGAVEVAELLLTGVAAVKQRDGTDVRQGKVANCEKLRPEIIDHLPIAVVEPGEGDNWVAARRD